MIASIKIHYDMDKDTLIGIETDPPTLESVKAIGILMRCQIAIDTHIQAEQMQQQMRDAALGKKILISNGRVPKE